MNTAMRVVDKKSARRYIHGGGCRCVFCGSDAITGEHVDVDAGGATQTVSCATCGGIWTDVYVLAGVVANDKEYDGR